MLPSTIPYWSDIGDVSPQTRNSWLGEITHRAKLTNYFTGGVFETETIPTEAGALEEEPELYPVGINLVKMLCLAQADSEFGEWNDDIVTFQPRSDSTFTKSELSGADVAAMIMGSSSADTLFWELALDRNIYGGAPIQIVPNLKVPGYIQWKRVPLDNFFPIWDPEDPDQLLEVYIVNTMTKEQAKAKYGIIVEKEIITRVDHWTKANYEAKIEDKVIQSGINPWGFVPFEYFPRYRSHAFWGDSLTEEVIRVQDELNMRVADLGEAINYNSHPVRWGRNLTASFSSRNFPVGPNAMWDIGKTIGPSPPPEVGILEAKNPVPQGSFEYIKFLYDWGRTSVMAPPIAFGEDTGGGQRSGVTLEIRMWPLIKATRRSRAYMKSGILRALKKSGQILLQKRLFSTYALNHLIEGNIVPIFAPVMPRDQAKLVDEVTKRMSTTPPTISLQSAVKKLGDNANEVNLIEDMLKNDVLYKRSTPFQDKPPGADGAAGNDEGESE